MDWTGLQWIGHCTSQSGLARGPLESTGVHMDYVGEGKDLGTELQILGGPHQLGGLESHVNLYTHLSFVA
ncbi:hypothetical protein K443DRAFT_107406 [Laccaria amethystina LaAM-08-1]|uniref:Uncharacterized protein n=1 Tax=Laccaria amethystina LaAM-08-1 TaxID=1095629 RepID=A0A0C9XFA8_9AGAR|nr:hypothetical protein K443DRAFT_107406 [Laccaria amethystina LaAM-08-1]